MAESEKVTPVQYLDRFFDELRNEVRNNPDLANRLVRAMGATVKFELEDAADAANPFITAAETSRAEFFAVYSQLKLTQIKKILRQNNLATTVDMRGKDAGALVDMMYDRAKTKLGERKL